MHYTYKDLQEITGLTYHQLKHLVTKHKLPSTYNASRTYFTETQKNVISWIIKVTKAYPTVGKAAKDLELSDYTVLRLISENKVGIIQLEIDSHVKGYEDLTQAEVSAINLYVGKVRITKAGLKSLIDYKETVNGTKRS